MADKSRKLKVEGNLSDITQDQLNIFFKNKRGQGGGPVEDIHKSEDNKCAVITFKEHEAVDLIMSRGNTVTISGVAFGVSSLVEKTVGDMAGAKSNANGIQAAQKSKTPSLVEKTNKLKVEGLSGEITKDQLSICFKNKRGQGGGPIHDIELSEDKTTAVITFKEIEAVHLIMGRGDTVTISGKAVQVSPFAETEEVVIPSSPDKNTAQKVDISSLVDKTNKLKVEGLSGEITKDQLSICFKNKRGQGGGPIDDIEISEDKTTAVITFKENEAVNLIMGRGDSVKISGKDLKVSPFIEKAALDETKEIPNPIQMPSSPEKKSTVKCKSATKVLKVKGLSGDITKDQLKIFFKNKRSQGGGSVEDVRLSDDNTRAFITFKKTEAVDVIMDRGDTVTISKAVLKVKPYYKETSERKTEAQAYSSCELQEEFKVLSKADKKISKSENKSLDKKIESKTAKVKSKTKSKEQPQAIIKKPEREKPPKRITFSTADNVDLEDEEQDTNLFNKTVRIKFSCLKESREDYILYLEDPELKSGEFYEDGLMLDGLHNVLYVTFHTSKAAQNFCRLNHPSDMNITCVNMATEDDFKTYPNYIYLHGMLGEFQELAQQIVDKTNLEVLNIIQHDEPNTCIVIFDPDICNDITHLTWELTCLDDKKLLTAPVYKTNSILVSGLTPKVDITTLKRYLENTKRSGGGKVKSLNKISDNQAVVYFEDDVDLEILLSKEDHKINDAELELTTHFPCLSKDYLQESLIHKQSVTTHISSTSSPQVKQLKIIPRSLFASKHTIKMEDKRFIGNLNLTKETFHFLKKQEKELTEVVQGAHCSMEILPQKLCLKLNLTEKVRAKEVKGMIESGFQNLYHFLNPFIVLKFCMEDPEIYDFQSYCGGKITDIYFDHEANEVTVIGSKSPKDLEDIIQNLYTEFLHQKEDSNKIANAQKQNPPKKEKQPAKDESLQMPTFKTNESSKPQIPVQQETFQYTNDIKLERYEFNLLQKSKYFDQFKENHKQTNLSLDSDTLNVVLRGNDESQINTILFEILNKCRQDVSCKKIDNLTPDQLELLKRENVKTKIDSILDNCCLHCNDTDAKLYYITSGSLDVDDAIKKVKSQVEMHNKKMNPETLSILKSTEGTKFLSSLKESSKDVSLMINFDSNNDLLIIAPVDQIYTLAKSIEVFLEKNKIYSKDVPISSGKQEFLKNFLMKEYNQIKSTLGCDATVELISDKCIIKGLKDSVGHGEKLVKELVSKIDVNNVTLKFFGIEEYLHDSEGKNLLRGIEHSNRCVIQLESDTPKDAKPKVPPKPPVLCAKTSIKGVNIGFFQGNVFGLKVDAVVNPLDSTLQFVSAMNKELINQGGLAIKSELESSRQSSSVGSVIETSSGALSSVKKIVHVVCPMYCDQEQLKDLKSAVRACLQHAVDQKYTSIGIPVIGLGKILKFPLLPACQQIVQAIKSCLESRTENLTDIYICDVKAKNIQEIMDRCETYFENVSLESISEPKDTKGSSKAPIPPPRKSIMKKGWDFKNIKVALTLGEVNKQDTDIIVITVDKSLDLSKGILAKTVLREAGDGIQNELLNRFTNGIEPGEFAGSGGGNLPCKHIFHACLSRFRGDNAQMEALVYKLLEGADKIQASSISIPALGTGNLGYPSDITAEVIMGTIEKYAAQNSNCQLKVCLVVFPKDQEVADTFKTVLSAGGKGATAVDHSEEVESGRSAVGGFFHKFQSYFKSKNQDETSQYGSVSLEVKQGDITKERHTDVIVNGIKDSMDLSHSGQVCKSLLRHCGQELQDECISKQDEMSNHGIVVTSAPKLPFKNIIHISQDQFSRNLDKGVTKVLEEAEKIGATSLSLPVLGAGAKSANLHYIKKCILGAITDFGKSKRRKLNRIKLVIYDDKVYQYFSEHEGRHAKSSHRESAAETPNVHISEEVKLKIYSDSAQERTLAEKKLKESCKSAFKEEKEKQDNLQRLSTTQIKQLQHEGIQHRIKVTVRAEEHLIIMQGFRSDGMLKVQKMLNNLVVEAVKQHHKSLLHAMPVSIEWQYKQGDKWRGFDTTLNSELEREHKTKTNKCQLADYKGRKIEIDFVNMKETFKDEKSGERSTFEIRRHDKTKRGEPLPKRWDKMLPTENLKIIPVQQGTTEFNEVEQDFRSKGGHFPVKKIERIQNKSLYQQYSVKRRELDLHNPKGHKNEEKLFHGTSADPIPQINENGFNRSYCGVNGTAYGKGVYFAVNSSYSVNYAKPDIRGNRHMYRVRVLTGENTPTSSATNFLPNKPGTNRPYDSGGDPRQGIYVIFHDAQVYPEYLITF